MRVPEFLRRFTDSLPGDPAADPAPRQVHGALWSPAEPTPVREPRLLAWSAPLAAELGLPPELFAAAETAAVLAGNARWPGMRPYAANYGGHQFGNWAGQLGDGRAIGLGELRRPDGALAELQLKGAGPTPYSRRGDGRAVLRSSVREFLCSEAMHWLGVPTTRALSLCATGEAVVRDMFYDGNPAAEPGAVVCRVAPSFLRFGNYELPASRGDEPLLRQLVDFTLTHCYPELREAHGPAGPASATALLREIAVRTARLLAHWQAVGFVHGVMNTDNLSILGLTIDYGPYGWLEGFDLSWTPNTTDAGQRRYCYGNQPSIGLWNTERLGLALGLLFDGEAAAEAAIDGALAAYRDEYGAAASRSFGRKLGIDFGTEPGDAALLQDLFRLLPRHETDFTLWFRGLGRAVLAVEPPTALPAELAAACYGEPPAAHAEALVDWLRRWWQRTRRESHSPAELAAAMDAVNPRYVLRNWLAQEAIDLAAAGDTSRIQTPLEVLQNPYRDQPGRDAFATKRPEWARHKPGCSALSCSS